MSVAKINAITVPRDRFQEFERRFAAQAGRVAIATGFEGYDLLRPNDDREVCLVVTRWSSDEDSAQWLTSLEFVAAQLLVGGPAGGGSEVWSFDVLEHEAAPERPEETGYRSAMVNTEKPEVDVPTGQDPSYQLELDDLTVGDGPEAVAGQTVEVHYVGVSWKTGKQFDASWDRGKTFKFGLGGGQVIDGWDQGVAGMKVGGRRRITIPPMLAYGKRGAGGVIGPDETLVFVVDLIGVQP